MFGEMLENVRNAAPGIHCITNYVTMNDCANVLLACGASPIMANEEAEAAEITARCDGLTINIGTLSRQAVPAMLAAGRRANELGHPVVLDPVGVGASSFRTKTALLLMKEIRFSAIRGNVSEMRALALAYAGESAAERISQFSGNRSAAERVSQFSGDGNAVERVSQLSRNGAAAVGVPLFCGENAPRGVDANEADRMTEENMDRYIAFAKDFSKKTKAVIAMTGAVDIVADAKKAFVIRNGHPMMSRVTGSGCQLSVLMAAFLAAYHMNAKARRYSEGTGCAENSDLTAAAAAVCALGLCGEKAYERLTPLDGNVTFRNYMIDAVYRLTSEELERGARYEIR